MSLRFHKRGLTPSALLNTYPNVGIIGRHFLAKIVDFFKIISGSDIHPEFATFFHDVKMLGVIGSSDIAFSLFAIAIRKRYFRLLRIYGMFIMPNLAWKRVVAYCGIGRRRKTAFL